MKKLTRGEFSEVHIITAVKYRLLGVLLVTFTFLFTVRADSRDPLWRFITGGRIRSFPAVGWDGSVYVLSDDRFLYALTPGGEQRWRYYLEERLTDCFAIGYDGMIYVGYKTGELIAVHGYGQKVWQYDTGGTLHYSPAIRSDGGICLATDEGDFFVISHTGALLWKRALGGAPSSPPAADVDNSLYIPLKTGELVALQPWGDVKWRLRLSGTPAAPAIGGDGRIYVGTAAGYLYAVDPALPKIAWSTSFQGGVFSPVVGANETVCVATGAGEVASVSADGETRWTIPLGEVPAGPCVLGADGTIFVSTLQSTLYALDPLGRIKWNVKVKGVLTQLCLSPQEILYAGSSDWAMYAFPAEKPSAAAWPAFQHDVSHTGASSRSYTPYSIERQYAGNPDFVYYQSLFLSGDAELMEKGLREIGTLVAADGVKERRPYLLYLLRRMAGFTVVEEEKGVKFPLRGFSEIRQHACELYTQLGGLEAYPLLLAVLKRDPDFRMKAVAARCLGRLASDRGMEAVTAMARLIQAGGSEPDNTFAREVVVAMRNIAAHQGMLPRDGVQALLAISGGPYNTSVRDLARETLRELVKGK
jgi:outer membrane protein assembly factor BamB